MSSDGTITRLAPSPTGALHLGNIRTFVLNGLLARQGGWRVRMRVEDLDSPRVKAGADVAMLEELRWLGLEWEGPIVYQSSRMDAYRIAWEELRRLGASYPCTCSRKDVQAAASAPHGDAGQAVYPGTCRPRAPSPCPLPEGEGSTAASARAGTGTVFGTTKTEPVPTLAAWRVLVDGEPIAVRDEFAGEHAFDLARSCGDFVIWTRGGQAAYQLAVVVDDAEAGVDAIVRGDDLLESAARQIHLRRLLGIGGTVRYWHLPLVVGEDGRRLAKRHGDTRLAHYRSAGATRGKVLGLVGYWSGMLASRQEAGWDELARRFDLGKVPRGPVVFTREDDRFLTGR